MIRLASGQSLAPKCSEFKIDHLQMEKLIVERYSIRRNPRTFSCNQRDEYAIVWAICISLTRENPCRS